MEHCVDIQHPAVPVPPGSWVKGPLAARMAGGAHKTYGSKEARSSHAVLNSFLACWSRGAALKHCVDLVSRLLGPAVQVLKARRWAAAFHAAFKHESQFVKRKDRIVKYQHLKVERGEA